jgi:arylsulfatase A
VGQVPDARDPDKPAGQLYYLADDITESNNLYAQHPEIVADLTALLTRIQRDGRSRPDKP